LNEMDQQRSGIGKAEKSWSELPNPHKQKKRLAIDR
jgi:hypothetical protein